MSWPVDHIQRQRDGVTEAANLSVVGTFRKCGCGGGGGEKKLFQKRGGGGGGGGVGDKIVIQEMGGTNVAAT